MEWTCCACEHQVDERYFDTEERMCDECMNLAYPDSIADKSIQLGASVVKSNDNVSGVFMVDGKIKDIDYFDSKEPDSSNINVQYVIDRLNNLELTGRNKKELCEIVDVLSEIQRQIYATGVALNQTTKE